ncbi:hypothetical protein HNQ96_002033 [Aminobacter lissarensis]|uniref:Uncharacterized protein n=1 Tax=Aminobacter carboxidus TaxID=376165 RepID=A0A8E1WDT5_9HYPH|nr:hypothetical protein [Aminobacter lissarensis]
MRGEVVLHARLFDKIKRGVVIAEGIWPSPTMSVARAPMC